MTSDSNKHRRVVSFLEAQFNRVVKLQYDTSVPPQEVHNFMEPLIADNVEFKDPWQRGFGKQRYLLGQKGFHDMFYFDFTVHQLNVDVSSDLTRGRAMVDGVMNLRQLQIYTYPLRTILVYEFDLECEQEVKLRIHHHQEMWSFGDMIENLPIIGSAYNLFRKVFAEGFLLCSTLAGYYQSGKKTVSEQFLQREKST